MVNQAATTTRITNGAALASASNENSPYTVQWSVTVNSPGSGTPTGNMTVSDGTDNCSAPVAAGQCNLTSTTGGNKTITATYAGDANYIGSMSGGVAHFVNPCVPAPPNMVSWWPGDGNANDIQGTNNGVVEGGATFAPAEVLQGFSMNGT